MKSLVDDLRALLGLHAALSLRARQSQTEWLEAVNEAKELLEAEAAAVEADLVNDERD